MNKTLLPLFVMMACTGYAQCPFSATLDGNGGCIGDLLTINSQNPVTSIVWYKDNAVVKTSIGTAASMNGVTVAGGNGIGDNSNQLFGPLGVFVDNAQNVYVDDELNNRVMKWAAGAANGILVAGGNGVGTGANQLNYPSSVCVNENGTVFVGDFYNFRIQSWPVGATNGITVAGGNGTGPAANQFINPSDVTIDASGYMYVIDQGNNRVQKFAPGSSSASNGVTVAGGNGAGSAANQLNNPISIYVDVAGNVYVSDEANARVEKWAPGVVTGITVAGGNGFGSGANQFGTMHGIFVDAGGNIFVADELNNRVQKWAPGATSGITVAGGNGGGSASNQLDAPEDVFVTPNGDIYVVDYGNDRVQKFSHGTIDLTYTIASPGTYTAIITDINGCMTTTNAFSLAPVIPPRVTIALAGGVAACADAPIRFTATTMDAGTQPVLQWEVNGANVGSNLPTFSLDAIGNVSTVTCRVTSNAACAANASAISNEIVVQATKAAIQVIITASAPQTCVGQSNTYIADITNANDDVYYIWQVNGIAIIENTNTFTTAELMNGDQIQCIIKTTDGCSTVYSNVLGAVVDELPVVTSKTEYVTAGQQVSLSLSVTGNISSYVWSPVTGLSDANVQNPQLTVSGSADYALEVVTSDGCIGHGNIALKINSALRVPNAFTPNDDGLNDVLFVLGGNGGDIVQDFTVFNRWGAIVFQCKNVSPGDPKSGWNGFDKGVAAPAGGYVYMMSVNRANGGKQIYKGTVLLIR